jgi:hypothetical protein
MTVAVMTVAVMTVAMSCGCGSRETTHQGDCGKCEYDVTHGTILSTQGGIRKTETRATRDRSSTDDLEVLCLQDACQDVVQLRESAFWARGYMQSVESPTCRIRFLDVVQLMAQ